MLIRSSSAPTPTLLRICSVPKKFVPLPHLGEGLRGAVSFNHYRVMTKRFVRLFLQRMTARVLVPVATTSTPAPATEVEQKVEAATTSKKAAKSLNSKSK